MFKFMFSYFFIKVRLFTPNTQLVNIGRFNHLDVVSEVRLQPVRYTLQRYGFFVLPKGRRVISSLKRTNSIPNQ